MASPTARIYVTPTQEEALRYILGRLKRNARRPATLAAQSHLEAILEKIDIQNKKENDSHGMG